MPTSLSKRPKPQLKKPVKHPGPRWAGTITETVVDLDPDRVIISKLNTRQPTAKEVAELVESFRGRIKAGVNPQIQPAIVRPLKGRPGWFEAAAGSRRKIACGVVKIKLQAIVREISDADFEDTILTENLCREDPNPMQEAILIERRLAAGMPASEICAKYGKTETWLKRRMKLVSLTKKAREAWAPGFAFEHFTTDMMEFIGALAKEEQNRMADDPYGMEEFRSLDALIEAHKRGAKELKGVPWLHDKATFIAGCGPGCATDTKESLFAADPNHPCGQCLNAQCFRTRAALHHAAQLTKLLDGKPESDFVFMLSKGYCANGDRKGVLVESIWPQHYKLAKKPGPDTVPAVDLADPAKPVIVHLQRKAAAKASGTAANGASNGAAHGTHDTPGLKAPREDGHTGKRLAALNELLKAHIGKAPMPSGDAHVPILHIVAAFGLSAQHRDCTDERSHKAVWDSLDAEPGSVLPDSFEGVWRSAKSALLTREEILWTHVKPLLLGRLHFRVNGDLLPAWKRKEMERIAKLTGFNYSAQWATICTVTLPPPKSWGPGIDPMTLKAAAPAKAATIPPAAEKKPAKKK